MSGLLSTSGSAGVVDLGPADSESRDGIMAKTLDKRLDGQCAPDFESNSIIYP
jgi:hypothetical protein